MVVGGGGMPLSHMVSKLCPDGGGGGGGELPLSLMVIMLCSDDPFF